MTDPVRLIPSSSRGEAQPQAQRARPALKFAAWGYIVLALFGLLALSVLAHQTAYFAFDLTLTQSVQKLASPTLDALALRVDWLGYLPEILLITAAVAVAQFFAGWRWEAVLTVIAAVVARVSVDMIKLLVRRPRPEVAGIHVYKALGDFTYPSGHVCSYFMNLWSGGLLLLHLAAVNRAAGLPAHRAHRVGCAGRTRADLPGWTLAQRCPGRLSLGQPGMAAHGAPVLVGQTALLRKTKSLALTQHNEMPNGWTDCSI
jgi:hypothetical protein